MSNLNKIGKTYNTEDRVTIEEETGIRHELVNGELFMMAGGTIRHSKLCNRMGAILDRVFKDSGCNVLNSDAVLRIEKINLNQDYYPDVSVVCEKIDDLATYYQNPTLLVEVLSDSSIKMDKFIKLNDYLSIKGLMGYLIVSQYNKEIEFWRPSEETIIYNNSNEIIKITNAIEFSIDEVYLGILNE